MFNRKPKQTAEPTPPAPETEPEPSLSDPPPPRRDQHGFMSKEYARWEYQQAELRQRGGVWRSPADAALEALDAQLADAFARLEPTAMAKTLAQERLREARDDEARYGGHAGTSAPDPVIVRRLEQEATAAAKVFTEAKATHQELLRLRNVAATPRNAKPLQQRRTFAPGSLIDGKWTG